MNRSAHMITAAIAFEDLYRDAPEVIDRIVELEAHHPERGPFEVATAFTTGADHARRLFMGMARWPDDIRGGAYDHPSWHAMARPIVDPQNPPPRPPPIEIAYDGFEALALNVHVFRNRRAPQRERAVALCWLFHLVGDVHQPLHTAEFYSADFPDGDQFGALNFMLDPETNKPVNLHWYWDYLVSRPPTPEAAIAKAAELTRQHPREGFDAILVDGAAYTAEFTRWVDESYGIAEAVAYGPDRPFSLSAAAAQPLQPRYAVDSVAAAERHFTLAGYRLADLVRNLHQA